MSADLPIGELLQAALLHQQDSLITELHAAILAIWPDYHFQTPTAFKAKLARLRNPERTARGYRLTPVRINEIEPGYTYLAATTGQTTGVFKLFTSTTPTSEIKPFKHLLRIDHE